MYDTTKENSSEVEALKKEFDNYKLLTKHEHAKEMVRNA